MTHGAYLERAQVHPTIFRGFALCNGYTFSGPAVEHSELDVIGPWYEPHWNLDQHAVFDLLAGLPAIGRVEPVSRRVVQGGLGTRRELSFEVHEEEQVRRTGTWHSPPSRDEDLVSFHDLRGLDLAAQ